MNKVLLRLIKKQNRLVELAEENRLDKALKISYKFGAPSFEDLKYVLFPIWEIEIDKAIKYIETNCFNFKNTDPPRSSACKIEDEQKNTPGPFTGIINGPQHCKNCS